MAAVMASGIPDSDLMDIDIDMDIDEQGAAIEDEFQLEEGEEPDFQPTNTVANDNTNIIPAIYTEDPSQEPQWEKVYVRGVDDFHTNDILAFVHDHDPEAEVHVQWIDDTSANIVYPTKERAREGILKLIAVESTPDTILNAPFEVRTAKTLASRPASMLMVRIAQAGDRKRKNARDASRYYLLHPDEDPAERVRREFANGRPRGGEGEYRRRRFDDREHRRRRHQDESGDATEFAASMYDDAPATEPEGRARGRDLFSRITRRRSASPGAHTRNSDEINISDSDDDRRKRRYRDRKERPPPYTRNDPAPVPKNNFGKELFSADTPKNSGLHSDRIDLYPSADIQSQPRQVDMNAAAAKRLKADLLSAAQTSPRAHHRRAKAMDARNDEDLAERFGRNSVSIDSTGKPAVELFPGGLNIKGSSQGMTIKGHGGFSIKGRALEVKELFPERYKRGGNEGKELFDEPVREKRVRHRAGDLFD